MIIPSSPKKICFIAPKAGPLFYRDLDGVFGGAEVDLYYLATELAKSSEYRIFFIVADYGQPAKEERERVTVLRSLDFKQGQVRGASRIWRALGRAGAHAYMMKTPSWGVPLVASFCYLNKRAFYYRTAHQSECDGTAFAGRVLLGSVHGWSLRSAEAVFTQNVDDCVRLQETMGVDPIVIPNGHRLGRVSAVPREAILWAGRSDSFKRPEKFVALAKRFPKWPFVMICQRATGDDNYEALCRLADSVPNLEFHRRVPFFEIDRFFRRAKIFVNTSDAEGFPNTFIQACKCGTPILSLTVNPDNFLDRHGCGYGCGGDESLLDKNLVLMSKSDRWEQLSRNTEKYVAASHDIEKNVERYKEIFGQQLR